MEEMKTNVEEITGENGGERVSFSDPSRGTPTRKKKRLTGGWQEKTFIISFLAYPVIMFVVFYIGINLNSILMAFRKYDFIGNWEWVDGNIFENFSTFVKDLQGANERMEYAFINSIKMYFINLVICIPLYIFFSYILFKRCPGHKYLRAIVMIPQIISGFVLCLVFKQFIEGAFADIMKWILDKEEFPNLLRDGKYAFGTCLFYMIWSSFSTSLIVYPNAMNEIDDGILEAAKLDGVNNMFAELWYIILPLIYPTLTTFIITGFAGILSNAGCVPTFYYLSAPTEAYNMGYYYWAQIAYTGGTYAGYPVLAAGGLLMTAIVAPLTLLLRWAFDKFGPDAEY